MGSIIQSMKYIGGSKKTEGGWWYWLFSKVGNMSYMGLSMDDDVNQKYFPK